MRITICVILLICLASQSGSSEIAKSRNSVTISHVETYGDEWEWEAWAHVRAEAYYKSSGERVTELNSGRGYVDCLVERREINGNEEYRIYINSFYLKVEKSNKKGYKYCARPKNKTYVYYFNF